MRGKSWSDSRIWLVSLFSLLLVCVISCGNREQPIGTYVADEKESPKQTDTSLELKENGMGTWKVGDDEVSFTWYVKGDELRVHTKGGGVIVGKLEKDAIRVTLPGSKTVAFTKAK